MQVREGGNEVINILIIGGQTKEIAFYSVRHCYICVKSICLFKSTGPIIRPCLYSSQFGEKASNYLTGLH